MRMAANVIFFLSGYCNETIEYAKHTGIHTQDNCFEIIVRPWKLRTRQQVVTAFN